MWSQTWRSVWWIVILGGACSENPLDPDDITTGSVAGEPAVGGGDECASVCQVFAQCEQEIGLALTTDCASNCGQNLAPAARQCVIQATQCAEVAECIGVTCDAVCEVLVGCGADAAECPSFCAQQQSLPSRSCVLVSSSCDEVAQCPI